MSSKAGYLKQSKNLNHKLEQIKGPTYVEDSHRELSDLLIKYGDKFDEALDRMNLPLRMKVIETIPNMVSATGRAVNSIYDNPDENIGAIMANWGYEVTGLKDMVDDIKQDYNQIKDDINFLKEGDFSYNSVRDYANESRPNGLVTNILNLYEAAKPGGVAFKDELNRQFQNFGRNIVDKLTFGLVSPHQNTYSEYHRNNRDPKGIPNPNATKTPQINHNGILGVYNGQILYKGIDDVLYNNLTNKGVNFVDIAGGRRVNEHGQPI